MPAPIRQLCVVEERLNLVLNPIVLLPQLVQVDVLFGRELAFGADRAKHQRLGVQRDRVSLRLQLADSRQIQHALDGRAERRSVMDGTNAAGPERGASGLEPARAPLDRRESQLRRQLRAAGYQNPCVAARFLSRATRW